MFDCAAAAGAAGVRCWRRETRERSSGGGAL